MLWWAQGSAELACCCAAAGLSGAAGRGCCPGSAHLAHLLPAGRPGTSLLAAVPDFAALRSSHFDDPSIKLRVVRGLSVDCGTLIQVILDGSMAAPHHLTPCTCAWTGRRRSHSWSDGSLACVASHRRTCSALRGSSRRMATPLFCRFADSPNSHRRWSWSLLASQLEGQGFSSCIPHHCPMST